jgi:hypothetical protein
VPRIQYLLHMSHRSAFTRQLSRRLHRTRSQLRGRDWMLSHEVSEKLAHILPSRTINKPSRLHGGNLTLRVKVRAFATTLGLFQVWGVLNIISITKLLFVAAWLPYLVTGHLETTFRLLFLCLVYVVYKLVVVYGIINLIDPHYFLHRKLLPESGVEWDNCD